MVAPRLDAGEIAPISTYLPWAVTDISLRPYVKAFSMNPSIHFDGETWRCVLRCADYGMPGGEVIRPPGVIAGAHQTKNAMVIFDPKGWKPITTHLMSESDPHPRNPAAPIKGFEDMRLFFTDAGGLQGIAASLHLERPKGPQERSHNNSPPEQVVLSFDDCYNIVDAQPIRGSWSSQAQKNWVPFDGAEEPRFLFSIEKGSLYGMTGPIDGLPKGGYDHLGEKNRYGTEIQLRRVTQPMLAGRTLPPRYNGLRGGSQLVHVGDGVWLGIGHEMHARGGATRDRKYYWHLWYTVNGDGQLQSMSKPMKVAPEGIEFVAGLAIDGDRVVVSYGVDDMYCRIGETSLDAVMDQLAPVSIEAPPPEPKKLPRRGEPLIQRPKPVATRPMPMAVRPPLAAPAPARAAESRDPNRPAEIRSGPHVTVRPVAKAMTPVRSRPVPAETRSTNSAIPAQPVALEDGIGEIQEANELGAAVLMKGLELAAAARRRDPSPMIIKAKSEVMHAINAYADLYLDEKGAPRERSDAAVRDDHSHET